jgi:hypothetical protein
VLLRSLASVRGLDCVSYAHAFAAHFGAASGFDGYRDVSTKGFLRNYGRGAVPPATGAPDAQANCIARLAPLVAAFGGVGGEGAGLKQAGAGDVSDGSTSGGLASSGSSLGAGGVCSPALAAAVRRATRVTQNSDAAEAWALAGAAVLERVVVQRMLPSAAVDGVARCLKEAVGQPEGAPASGGGSQTGSGPTSM